MQTLKAIALWSLSGLLALLFLAAGISKFMDPAMAQQFAHWGYADWFRTLIGVLEIGGGLALLVPRTAWQGAAILAIVTAGAVATLVRFGDSGHVLVPSAVFVLLVLLGYLRYPRSLRQRLYAAADWVAEHEIAEHHRLAAAGNHRVRL
jgi:putative oxidoreductase